MPKLLKRTRTVVTEEFLEPAELDSSKAEEESDESDEADEDVDDDEDAEDVDKTGRRSSPPARRSR